MSAGVLAIEALIFAAIFTAVLFSTLPQKESISSIHNYPPDIQEEYFKTHKRQDVSYRSKKVIVTKCAGILVFTLILSACAYFAGAKTFPQGFLVAFLLMVWIGAYDTFFLDWVLFANMKCFRLPGTEHMDRAYHQKWFHLRGMLFPGIVFALIPSALVGLIIQWIA
ncbi:MAG: hypothetical protein IJ083_18500 [Clostridia bacterium]|nr:hypothetical protein [Clostridia bacterium]